MIQQQLNCDASDLVNYELLKLLAYTSYQTRAHAYSRAASGISAKFVPVSNNYLQQLHDEENESDYSNRRGSINQWRIWSIYGNLKISIQEQKVRSCFFDCSTECPLQALEITKKCTKFFDWPQRDREGESHTIDLLLGIIARAERCETHRVSVTEIYTSRRKQPIISAA